MFKSIQILCFLVTSLLVSCTVSEEEKAADEQRHRDSIAAAQAMIRAAQQANETRANALNLINQDALKLDSILKKDSIGAIKKDTTIMSVKDSAKNKKADANNVKKDIKPNTPVAKKSTSPATNKANTTKTGSNTNKPVNNK